MEEKQVCNLCRHRNQNLRHRHLVNFPGDLAEHVRDNMPRRDDGKIDQVALDTLLTWVHNLKGLYGNKVSSVGVPLSVSEARTESYGEYSKRYRRPHGAFGFEPTTPDARQASYIVQRALMASAKSRHASAWLEMLETQFPKGVGDNESWGKFKEFLWEYRRSSIDPENAEFLGRVDQDYAVRAASNFSR